jgi:hypothetical protein
MTLFRLTAALVIAGVAGAIILDLRRGRKTWSGTWRMFRDQARSAFASWNERGRMSPGEMNDTLRRLAYVCSAGLFAILAVTGFLPVVLLGDRLSGLLLIIHVTAAPLFAVSLAALALLWAHRLRFQEDDWHILLNPAKRARATRDRWPSLAVKAAFWLVLLCSLPLMGSIILSLFPLFGTEGEEALARLHGYSALLMLPASIAVIHLTISYIRHASEQPSKESTR